WPPSKPRCPCSERRRRRSAGSTWSAGPGAAPSTSEKPSDTAKMHLTRGSYHGWGPLPICMDLQMLTDLTDYVTRHGLYIPPADVQGARILRESGLQHAYGDRFEVHVPCIWGYHVLPKVRWIYGSGAAAPHVDPAFL